MNLMIKAARWRSLFERSWLQQSWAGQKLVSWWLPLTVIAVGIISRFINHQSSLYFIYDQGRDAWKLQALAEGQLSLIGPTTGLAGFFLGPLWYIALACLAVPLFWWMSRLLFVNTKWTLISALALIFVPGSVWGSIFIWNPLISIPLMTGAYLAFVYARESRLALALGFFLTALTLQSEFAYAVFLLPVLVVLIPWIRQRWSVLDFLTSGLAVFVTLIPQIVFELRHVFIMTQSLWAQIMGGEGTISWWAVLMRRPSQLLWATQELLIRTGPEAIYLTVVFVALMIYGLYLVKTRSIFESSQQAYAWKLLGLLAVTPYVLFMFWTGNYGNFFSYYLTSHFIFLVPLLVLGIKHLGLDLARVTAYQKLSLVIPTVFLTILFFSSGQFYTQTVLKPNNQAGMAIVDRAVGTVLTWQNRDTQTLHRHGLVTDEERVGSVLVFTPNFMTEQYDYFIHWRANRTGTPIPYSQVEPDTPVVQVIIEPDRQIPEKRFDPWYARVVEGRVRTRREMRGVLLLETWMNEDLAEELLIEERELTTQEVMGW